MQVVDCHYNGHSFEPWSTSWITACLCLPRAAVSPHRGGKKCGAPLLGPIWKTPMHFVKTPLCHVAAWYGMLVGRTGSASLISILVCIGTRNALNVKCHGSFSNLHGFSCMRGQKACSHHVNIGNGRHFWKRGVVRELQGSTLKICL